MEEKGFFKMHKFNHIIIFLVLFILGVQFGIFHSRKLEKKDCIKKQIEIIEKQKKGGKHGREDILQGIFNEL